VALRRARRCTAKGAVGIFRSPAFNFDPENTLQQQKKFASLARPAVEAEGFHYLDQFAPTFRAAFQPAPAVRFARGSTFHYLNSGRYLMAQTLLHLLRLL
jgi:hypothetical protein